VSNHKIPPLTKWKNYIDQMLPKYIILVQSHVGYTPAALILSNQFICLLSLYIEVGNNFLGLFINKQKHIYIKRTVRIMEGIKIRNSC
jgi:hypothetical protein